MLPRLPGALALPDELKTLAASPPRQPGGAASPPAAVGPAPQKNGVTIPEALQSPEPPPAVDNQTPFAFGDFSWLNGTSRSGPVVDTKFFTGEVRFDTHYMEDFNQPIDHSIVGSTESFRSGEVQIEQASVGGDYVLLEATITHNSRSPCSDVL